jgi:hypothetical protein
MRVILPNEKKKVCILVKSLYGLKQALKQWHEKFDKAILLNDFHHNNVNKCMYSKFTKDFSVIIYLYVDGMRSLMYVMYCTRPDINFSIFKLSRYTSKPNTNHWKTIARAFGYLKKNQSLWACFILIF